MLESRLWKMEAVERYMVTLLDIRRWRLIFGHDQVNFQFLTTDD
jgi:hypothetical protein